MRRLLVVLSLMAPLFAARGAMADDLVNDARLEAYSSGTKGVVLDAGSAPYFLLLGALGGLGVSVMFKDAKRTDAKK